MTKNYIDEINCIEDLRKWWKENNILCHARHFETYNGGEQYDEGCDICFEVVETFIKQKLQEVEQRKVEEIKIKIEEIKKKYRCGACDGAKNLDHCMTCRFYQEIIKSITNEE